MKRALVLLVAAIMLFTAVPVAMGAFEDSQNLLTGYMTIYVGLQLRYLKDIPMNL